MRSGLRSPIIVPNVPVSGNEEFAKERFSRGFAIESSRRERMNSNRRAPPSFGRYPFSSPEVEDGLALRVSDEPHEDMVYQGPVLEVSGATVLLVVPVGEALPVFQFFRH